MVLLKQVCDQVHIGDNLECPCPVNTQKCCDPNTHNDCVHPAICTGKGLNKAGNGASLTQSAENQHLCLTEAYLSKDYLQSLQTLEVDVSMSKNCKPGNNMSFWFFQQDPNETTAYWANNREVDLFETAAGGDEPGPNTVNTNFAGNPTQKTWTDASITDGFNKHVTMWRDFYSTDCKPDEASVYVTHCDGKDPCERDKTTAAHACVEFVNQPLLFVLSNYGAKNGTGSADCTIGFNNLNITEQ